MMSYHQTQNFENLSFNPFLNQNSILMNNNVDPDENFLTKMPSKTLTLATSQQKKQM